MNESSDDYDDPVESDAETETLAEKSEQAIDGLMCEINELLAVNRGRPASSDTTYVRRRVLRNEVKNPGYAQRTARIFERLILAVNDVHRLQSAPMTIRHVLERMHEGRTILKQAQISEEEKVLAQAALEITNAAAGACKGDAVGILAKGNDMGKLPTRTVSQLVNMAQSTVRGYRREEEKGIRDESTFKSLGRAPALDASNGGDEEGDNKVMREMECVNSSDAAQDVNLDRKRSRKARRKLKRNAYPKELGEKAATRKWMKAQNPSRSGDKRSICWMVKGKEDFYSEDYRSVDGQIAIMKQALELRPNLRTVAFSKPPCELTRWLRNVRTYLDAENTGMLHKLRVKPLACDAPALTDEDLEEAIKTFKAAMADEEVGAREPTDDNDDEQMPIMLSSSEDDDSDEEEHEPDEDTDMECNSTICPRGKGAFYKSLCKGLRLWKRPPHDHCQQCNAYTTMCEEHKQLSCALNGTDKASIARVQREGGPVKAQEKKRELEHKLPVLKKHVEWRENGREYLKHRRANQKPREAFLELDYGGFTDSAGAKVSAWSATVTVANQEQVHLDFLFDASKAKKDGRTGIYFLNKVLGKRKGGDPLFKALFPKVTHLVLSGDTGNGFRAYEMLEELSKVFKKYNYSVELVPLPPGHAFNKTDTRFAHLNTMVNILKAKSRLFGAKMIAGALQRLSDPRVGSKRKFMARSYVFFADMDDLPERGSHPGRAQLVDDDLEFGHVGVKGLIYFNFSVNGKDGKPEHPEGYARVREYNDPNRLNNPTRLYTWRPELLKSLCQNCSNIEGRPVLLEKFGCTKGKGARSKPTCARNLDKEEGELEDEVEEPEDSEEKDPEEDADEEEDKRADEEEEEEEDEEEEEEEFSTYTWQKRKMKVGSLCLIAHADRDEDEDHDVVWVGKITRLLEVIYDERFPEKYEGDVEVHEYGRKTAKSACGPLYMTSSGERLVKTGKCRAPHTSAKPILTTVWAESISLHGPGSGILTAAGRLTKAAEMHATDLKKTQK
jgi:hypothetical protein